MLASLAWDQVHLELLLQFEHIMAWFGIVPDTGKEESQISKSVQIFLKLTPP